MNLVYSYTLLNTWGICPHQAMRKYIAKDLPPETKTQAQLDGTAGHQAVEARVRHKTPLPPAMARWEALVAPLDKCTVEPEQKLGVAESGRPVGFWGNDVWLRGALDAPILLSADTAVLVDWKTGKRREDPFELEIGAVLLQASRPEIIKIYGCYVWLREGVKGTPHNVSHTAKTWARVQERVNEIETAIEDNRFAKTPGPLCGWCPVKDCEHNRSAR